MVYILYICIHNIEILKMSNKIGYHNPVNLTYMNLCMHTVRYYKPVIKNDIYHLSQYIQYMKKDRIS